MSPWCGCGPEDTRRSRRQRLVPGAGGGSEEQLAGDFLRAAGRRVDVALADSAAGGLQDAARTTRS
jgi:hypothetical protein